MVFPSIRLVNLQSMVGSTGDIWTCQATWGWFLSFGTTIWCTKTWGDPPLDCIYIYTLLYNVNIVMLLDANSIDTKNLKGVDSVGFPDSAITPRRVYKIGCLYTIRQSIKETLTVTFS